MLNKKLAIESAAYLLKQIGGRAPCLDLLFLAYLADRDYLLEYGWRMTCDLYMNLGTQPALAGFTNGVYFGDLPQLQEIFEFFPETYEIGLRNQNLSLADLSALSLRVAKVLEETVAKYWLSEEKLVAESEDIKAICPEWSESLGQFMKDSDVLRAHGRSEREIEDILSNLRREEPDSELIE